ncbi:hypothetical protein [Sphingobacterium sp. HMA12]|uniref:hypothetical protein n=1 Tax=Sphingobacterium sp. HMA12 TaxID=2050894 RepID=UPI000CE9DE31|nr:hypothetical protein [Sphingobacterium sp. HMA12]
MHPLYANLLAADLLFYNIHKEDYDPISDILNFWDNYDLESIHQYLLDLSILIAEDVKNLKFGLERERIQEFLLALIRTAIAYYVAHLRKLELKDIELSIANNVASEVEFKRSRIIFDFFKSI